ncbi:hypothetical protein A3N43_04560 [Klebsiella aerogenes]|jgi:hypothetical protein|nr:hypothetical protein A3N43_04560 [Klebsiella aerogenes]
MPGGGCALPGLRFVRPAFNVFTTLDPPVALPLTGDTALRDLVARRRRNAPPPGKPFKKLQTDNSFYVNAAND